jgi:hypothetical protein
MSSQKAEKAIKKADRYNTSSLRFKAGNSREEQTYWGYMVK